MLADGGELFKIGNVPEEKELPDLEALKAGDPNEWDWAFRWLWPAAFDSASAKLPGWPPEDLRDIAIEAVHALVRKVPGLRHGSELKPLLAVIARNLAISHLRKRKSQKEGEGKIVSLDAAAGDGGNLPELASEESPFSLLTEKEQAERLRRVLDGLKPPQGDMLADYFLHEMKQREIADKYGVDVKAVGIMLARALKALRRSWDGEKE